MIIKIFVLLFFAVPNIAFATGNITIQSFSKAKRYLEREVHIEDFMRMTLYCGASYSSNKAIILPHDFIASKHKNRASRVEWEHVVPAENFGRTFTEWQKGNPLCVDKNGKTFKGRKCAEKINKEYRLMQSDMYNLYPAIGAVNATRSNYNFLPMSGSNTFGTGCDGMIISDRKVSPPTSARGQIARAYLYMEAEYDRYKMSDSQRKLMDAWNRQQPVTQNECIRTKRIEEIQGNNNNVVKNLCIQNGYW